MASDVRLTDYTREGDDTLLHLCLPTLGSAAPELYDQAELWPTMPAADFTAVDVLSEVVAEVDRGDPDGIRYDRHLLRKLSSIRRVFSPHLRSVALPRGSRDSGRVHLLTEDTAVVAVDQMREFFGKRVLVLGKAVYRPSGSLLRLDAHAIQDGVGQPSIFSAIPPPRSRRVLPPKKQTPGQGWDSLSAYFGGWPGDETDAQWNQMMLALKK
jgi:hypothetical protein